MNQPLLKNIELFAIGRDEGSQSWSAFLGPMCEAVVIARLTFDDDVTGIAGITVWTEHEFDQTAFASVYVDQVGGNS